ncbi:hydroxymethylglutaryl-CoA synthase, cytoplasmic-like [Octopus sinensis]|uniref:Hydroxymethylglutaryl-CoA synthase, cytoplasmic-like n=1 Tax=Octopus sinensis TaxID=2607531 RepID=A0A7E6EJV3_9MOLL|nr:hydroxymethylglutaryl-CoA synthase, cytoplasmic-like [Octopus sinensis]
MPVNRTNLGIVSMSAYVPKLYVGQDDLERLDGVSTGRYTIGIGQSQMAFCSDREDVVSLAMNAVDKLMRTCKIDYKDIGRLEVGTESIVDKCKSVKSYLMALFAESGNRNVEGVDCINACYGGTAALFNSINWLESSAWDGHVLCHVGRSEICLGRDGRHCCVLLGECSLYGRGGGRGCAFGPQCCHCPRE